VQYDFLPGVSWMRIGSVPCFGAAMQDLAQVDALPIA
jgi:hypothetical protein